MPKYRLDSLQDGVEYVYVLDHSESGEHKVVRNGQEVNLTVAEANASGLNFVRLDSDSNSNEQASQPASKTQ